MISRITKSNIKTFVDIFFFIVVYSTPSASLRSIPPGHNTVMATSVIGKSLGLQYIAKIGDVLRFTRRETITVFADVEPDAN